MRVHRKSPVLLLLTMLMATAACEADMEADETAVDQPAQPAQEAMQPGQEEMQPGQEEMQPAVDTAALRADMDRFHQEWVQAANDGDITAIAAMYAEDAVMVGASGEEWQGAGAIREGLSASFRNVTSFDATAMATEIGVDLVAEMGTFTQTLRMEQGELTQEGYYLVLARQEADGQMRIVQHLALPFQQPEGEQASM